MSRWAPDARERLERAALELFAEQGFAATTVPQITARAGLTTRTFFRHFGDKREVFFGDDEIPRLAARMIADAPAGHAPMRVVVDGLHQLAQTRFEPRREQVRAARAVIAANEELRERDLRKRAGLADAIRDGFLARGTDPATAALVAAVTVDVLDVALERWLESNEPAALEDGIDDALATLRTLSASTTRRSRTRRRASG